MTTVLILPRPQAHKIWSCPSPMALQKCADPIGEGSVTCSGGMLYCSHDHLRTRLRWFAINPTIPPWSRRFIPKSKISTSGSGILWVPAHLKHPARFSCELAPLCFSQEFIKAPHNHPMRHTVFGHNLSMMASRCGVPQIADFLLAGKIVARNFPSVRKCKLAFSARALASAAPTANLAFCSRHDWPQPRECQRGRRAIETTLPSLGSQ